MDKEKVLLKVMAFMERSERISIEDALQLFDEFNIGKIAAISRIPRETSWKKMLFSFTCY